MVDLRIKRPIKMLHGNYMEDAIWSHLRTSLMMGSLQFYGE
jgi:hypothetical protein